MIDLSPFKALIGERCGLQCEGNCEDKLRASLMARMGETGCADWVDYLARLRSSPVEFQELINQLTINETYFFREPEQISLLTDKLVPRLLARGAKPLAIMSAGCSSGEEPYSIAMALREKYGEVVQSLFTFVGCDIDSSILARARAGQYSEFSFRGTPSELRARYFDSHGQRHRIKDCIRDLVSFQELNLFAPPPPSMLGAFDVIFLRNVSIYFDTPARRVIQQNLASLMKDDGILVIGTAETLANDLGVLSLVEEDGLFYFAKGQPRQVSSGPAASFLRPLPTPAPVAKPQAYVPSPIPAASPVAKPVVAPVSSNMPDLEAVRLLVKEKHYDEAMAALDALLHRAGLNGAALLLKAHIWVERKDFTAAEAAAQQALELDPWSVDAFMLLGLCARWTDRHDDALRWFRQAAYACNECWPAHYYLGDLYRSRGDHEAAKRSYRVVIQLIGKEEKIAGIKVVPLILPEAEIRFLCEHQLTKLGGQPAVAVR